MTILYGEYPYYRARPDRWEANLAALAEAGIDVVTCYVPWRFHEIAPGRYDFAGRTDPQRDVLRLLRLISAAGLRAVLKPGPFVHAEIQLGGLPDRVSPSVDPSYLPVVNAEGEPATSQGLALPSLFCDRYRAEVRHWLRAVDEEVLSPALAPDGPIVGVQLGNEGIYSDAAQPVTAHDFSAPALRAFNREAAVAPERWPAEVRAAWAEWTGTVLRDHYRGLAADVSPATRAKATVNLPLPSLDGIASWLLRTAAIGQTGLAEGYTSWVGNPARDRRAFFAHWFGVRARRSSNVEDNWGFTWTDPAFARPATPIFTSLLALALDSGSCAVYTACATEHWGPLIDLDPAGLRGEGLDPADYGPPYCPGAPLREDGTSGANLAALRALRDLSRDDPPAGRFAADLALLVPTALARTAAWTVRGESPGTVLSTAVEAAMDLMTNFQYRIDVLTEATAAAGSGIWLIPLGARGPDERLLALVGEHRRTGGTVVLLTDRARPGWAEIGDVLVTVAMARKALPRLLPGARYAHPDSDPGVAFVHEDRAGTPVGLFAFNPTPDAVTVRRLIGGQPVAVELAPGGAAYLAGRDDKFTPALTTEEMP